MRDAGVVEASKKTTNRNQSATRSSSRKLSFSSSIWRRFIIFRFFSFFFGVSMLLLLLLFFSLIAESICTRAFLRLLLWFGFFFLSSVQLRWHTRFVVDDEKCFWLHVED